MEAEYQAWGGGCKGGAIIIKGNARSGVHVAGLSSARTGGGGMRQQGSVLFVPISG
jgi:hypothetical protein